MVVVMVVAVVMVQEVGATGSLLGGLPGFRRLDAAAADVVLTAQCSLPT